MKAPITRWVAPAMLAVVVFTAVGKRAEAMPMFARKYNMQCASCHTMPPRLTPMGYKFLRSGFRIAGMEQPAPALTNAVSLLTEFTATSTHPDGDSGFDSGGAEIQVATSVGDDLAARMGLVFPSGETPTFDESWIQYNAKAPERIMSLRAGQIPVMSGFQLGGARNITLSDPMMFGNVGPFDGSSVGNFSLAGLERGMEFGVTQGALTGKLSWLNGVDVTGAGNVPLHGKRAKDVAIQGEYLLGDTGTHIGAIYYSGKTPLSDYENKFNRGAVFGTYAYPLKAGGKMGEMTLELNGAYLWGKDQIPVMVDSVFGKTLTLNASAGSTQTMDAKSKGTLLELSLYQPGKTAYTLRYDTIKPSDVAGTVTTKATTLAATHMLNNNIRVAAEYRKQMDPDTDSVIASVWFFY